MTIQLVNVGSGPNAQDADSIRDGLTKVNSNFLQVDNRLKRLERSAHPFGAYEDPGFPPFPAFTYGDRAWEGYTSVGRIHENDGLTSASISNGARVFAMSATRFLLAAIVGSSLLVKIFELTESGLEKVADQTSSLSTSSAKLFSVAIISKNFAKVLYFLASGSSSTLNSIEVDYTDTVLSVGAVQYSGAISTASSGISPSNNSRAALLNNSSAISFYRGGSTGAGHLWSTRVQTGQGLNRHLDSAVGMSFVGTSTSNPSYDYLSENRFIVAHVSSTIDSDGVKLGISVVEADDDQTKVLGTTHFMSDVAGGISVFSLSPTLAIVSWQAGGVHRTISVGINSDGQPYLLGPASSSGASGTPLICGTPYDQTSLLAASWPTPTDPGRLVHLSVDTDTGVISESGSIDYDMSWAASQGKWLDMIRLGENRVLVAATPTVSPYGVVLDVLDLDVA